MSRQETYISIPFVPNGYLLRGWLLLALLSTALLSAQQQFVSEHRLAFFEARAWEDAAYEQVLPSMSEEDELDFWTDQRKFESSLQKHYMEGYQVYLCAKRAAYMEHQEACNAQCAHGDYYRLQASYYAQQGEQATEAVTLASSNSH